MALFPWRGEYSMKVPSIDVQHHKLVDMLNDLYDAMMAGNGREKLGALLGGLIDYTASHFAHEEEYFELYHYPEAEKHTQEHRDLTKQVLAFKEKFESGRATLTLEIMVFLKDWLIQHILGSDRAYSSHLVERGAK